LWGPNPRAAEGETREGEQMRSHQSAHQLAAIVYTDGRAVDPLVRMIVNHLKSRGAAVADFVQWDEPHYGRRRCDMMLEEMSSGERIGISVDRGPQARGCMLDFDELSRAESLAVAALDTQPEFLVINKFGKTEAEGSGFRGAISMHGATSPLGLPPIFAIEHLATDVQALCSQLGFVALARGRPASHVLIKTEYGSPQ
jgi:hypothetical protein